MKRLITVLAALTLLPVATNAAVPTVVLESQAWWRKAGIVVPSAVGAHVHVKATVPVDGAIVDGIIDVPYTVTLHDARGKTSWLRMGTENTELFSQTLVLGPCHDCTASGVASLNVGRLSTGRHELRMSANNPDEDPDLAGAQRMFQSTGYQFCVRSCTPSYRSGPVTIARGWYTDAEYAVAQLESPVSDVRSGASVKIRMTPGSGGRPTKFSGVYIDPDMHGGNVGIVVREIAGPFQGSVTLPTLTGSHRLVLVSSDGQNAAVLVVPFGSGTPTPSPAPTPTVVPTPVPTPVITPTPTC